MLLIENEETKFLKGDKHRRTGANHQQWLIWVKTATPNL